MNEFISSNQPSQSENKTAFQLLGIETLALLIAIIFIIAILNYLNIFPLSKNYPAFFGLLPHQESNKASSLPTAAIPTQTARPIRREVVNPTLETSSDVPSYSLELQNKEELVKLLQDWRVYGLPFLQTPGASKPQHIESIVIKLVAQEQPFNKVMTPDKNVYLSSNVVPQEDNTITVFIHVDQDIIEKRTVEAGGFIQSEFLSTMYRQQESFNNPNIDQKQSEEKLLGILVQLNRDGKEFFVISKE